MERRRNDPQYQMHEPPQPQGDEEKRLSADEFEKQSLETENSDQAVQRRENTNRPAPSRVRELHEEKE